MCLYLSVYLKLNFILSGRLLVFTGNQYSLDINFDNLVTEHQHIPTTPINTETEPPIRRLIMHCVSTQTT